MLMLTGAFIAAAAAALGGQHRDEDWRARPGCSSVPDATGYADVSEVTDRGE
jgi:hypothetical protein